MHVRLSQYGLPSMGMLKRGQGYIGEEGEVEKGMKEGQKIRGVYQPSLISRVFVHGV